MISYTPIGIIYSPFKGQKGTPIQPEAGLGVEGRVEVFPEYREGLTDLEGFSHIILLYHLHLCEKASLKVKPYLDEVFHGVFSTRAPCRPNPIGLSVVRLTRVDQNVLHIQDLDIIDGSPLLDIKPYVRDFDQKTMTRFGWLENKLPNYRSTKDDGSFSGE